MCGSLFGGSRSTPPPTLVSAPAATSVVDDGHDKVNKALEQDKRAAQKYGASKTNQHQGSTLGNPTSGTISRPKITGF